ncbi:MAG: dephospho-CoA kinase [Bryobacteraceae bacterium]
MLRAGLTGGYATGKSFVARELEQLGCFVIYADRLGHKVLEPGGGAYDPTVRAFGPAILAPDGSIDRKKLGSVAFSSHEALQRLSGFVHPAVFRLEEELLIGFDRQNPAGIAVIEAAILIETGRCERFRRLILTACEEETQIERGMKRDGLTREQVLARIAHQMPLEEKKRHAHYVIDTGGPKEATARRVREIHRELSRLAQSGG